jgi:hypothetical protein
MNDRCDRSYRLSSANVCNHFSAETGSSPCLKMLLVLVGGVMWLTPSMIAAQVATPVTLDGIIQSDSDDTLAFTPDNNTVFFDRSAGPHKTIMISHHASFSGHWFDQDPLVSPDGSYVLFNSDRPVKAGGKPLTQDYFVGGSAPGSNIWKVGRTGDGWGDPVWLGPTINSDVFIDFASLAADGTLYFIRWNPTEKAMHIWRSKQSGGQYLPAEIVTIGDPAVSVHDPAVAPDQSFMVLDYGKVKGGLGRLCISFRDGDHWDKPIDLGDELNKDLPWGAHIAPGAHAVYVTGQSGISQISLDPWLNAHRHNAGPLPKLREKSPQHKTSWDTQQPASGGRCRAG